MWILPNNLPALSAYAPEYVDSIEELSELLKHSDGQDPAPWLMWRSKPSAPTTWLRRWKRVWWIQHLFGRMLKPSQQKSFTEKWTGSLAATHAPVNRWPDCASYISTTDGFGRLYVELSRQCTLWDASSKTWEHTLRARIRLFTAAYDLWVTGLRQDYSARRKWVHHMRGSGSLSSQFPTPSLATARQGQNDYDGRRGQTLIGAARGQIWTTPTAFEFRDSMEVFEKRAAKMKDKHHNGNGIGMPLALMVKKWATPTVPTHGRESCPSDLKRKSPLLQTQVKWSTPQARDMRSGNRTPESLFKRNTQDLNIQSKVYSLPHQDSNSMTGKSQEQLNPAWVAQLMGTTLEVIFFGHSAMQLKNTRQKKHSSHSHKK